MEMSQVEGYFLRSASGGLTDGVSWVYLLVFGAQEVDKVSSSCPKHGLVDAFSNCLSVKPGSTLNPRLRMIHWASALKNYI
jgi:hypothetical protein